MTILKVENTPDEKALLPTQYRQNLFCHKLRKSEGSSATKILKALKSHFLKEKENGGVAVKNPLRKNPTKSS